MVLSGTLREFILADVFQLLTQQKITGKLHLSTNIEEGFVVFKNGAIVSAFKDTERFETKLENFLSEARGISVNQINSLLVAFKDDPRGLTNDLVAQSIMSPEEIATLSQSTVEDITCSMFLWKTGSYKFNSMRNVDKLIPGDCLIPIENIVMEAMRRFDEWKRMQELMNEESIFVLTAGPASVNNHTPLNPIYDPVNYLCQKINGISPVKEFISTTPLTQYKIYESLYALLQSNQITPLSDRITKSVHAALEKTGHTTDINSPSTFFSSILVAGFILIVILLSTLVFKGIFLSKISVDSYISRSELPRAIAKENKHIAQSLLQADGDLGMLLNSDSLTYFKLISKRDLRYFKIQKEAEEK